MKRLILGLFLLSLIFFLIPIAAIPLRSVLSKEVPVPASTSDDTTLAGDSITSAVIEQPYTVTLYRVGNGETQTMDFEAYITALVMAELPPTAPTEAIKAQAVAARSYILSRLSAYAEQDAPPSHHGAMLCDDFSHCRSWRSADETCTSWDERFRDDYTEKFKQAVKATNGEYLTYENKVAKACFHAVSSGKTENAADIWGYDLPYLRSVSSLKDERADGYRSRVFYPLDAFYTVLRGLRPQLHTEDTSDSIFTEISRFESGSVRTVQIANEVFDGGEIQEAFHLRSRNFSLSLQDGKAVFDVRGYGHGVGMSQFGAISMANDGKSYREILAHYYTDTKLTQLYHNA